MIIVMADKTYDGFFKGQKYSVSDGEHSYIHGPNSMCKLPVVLESPGVYKLEEQFFSDVRFEVIK